MSGQSDANIDFDALVRMLEHYGFTLRIKGSHHIFERSDVSDILSLPRHGKHIKRIYVRKVRDVIRSNHIGD